MKKLILHLAFVLIASQSIGAQTSPLIRSDTTRQLQNSTYFEFAGSSLIGVTFNYERFLSQKPGGFSVRLGAGGGLIPGIFDASPQFFAAIPAGLSYNVPLLGDNHDFLELGGTYTLIVGGTGSYSTSILAANAGWRHVSDSGIQIRVTLLPYVYSFADDRDLGIFWVGFSIGKRF